MRVNSDQDREPVLFFVCIELHKTFLIFKIIRFCHKQYNSFHLLSIDDFMIYVPIWRNEFGGKTKKILSETNLWKLTIKIYLIQANSISWTRKNSFCNAQWSEGVTKTPWSSEQIEVNLTVFLSFCLYFEQKSVFKHFQSMNNPLKSTSKVKKNAQK